MRKANELFCKKNIDEEKKLNYLADSMCKYKIEFST